MLINVRTITQGELFITIQTENIQAFLQRRNNCVFIDSVVGMVMFSQACAIMFTVGEAVVWRCGVGCTCLEGSCLDTP